MLFESPYMLFEYIPMRNFRGIARLVRLLATRNQYRRVDFMRAYMSYRRFVWYLEWFQLHENSNTRLSNTLYVPITHKFVGGGNVRATWSGRELNQYCPNTFAPDNTVYSFVKHKVMTPGVKVMESGHLSVSMPLAYLAVKLPIRTLVEVCARLL